MIGVKSVRGKLQINQDSGLQSQAHPTAHALLQMYAGPTSPITKTNGYAWGPPNWSPHAYENDFEYDKPIIVRHVANESLAESLSIILLRLYATLRPVVCVQVFACGRVQYIRTRHMYYINSVWVSFFE